MYSSVNNKYTTVRNAIGSVTLYDNHYSNMGNT